MSPTTPSITTLLSNSLSPRSNTLGGDYDKDMAAIAADEQTQRWWKLTDGMQESFHEGATGSGGDVPWWTDLEEVFHFKGGSSV